MYIFQEKILELKKRKGISQKEIAKITGIDYVNINRYFRGIIKPSIDNLIKLAELFNVSTDYLLGREEKSFSSPEKREIKNALKALEGKIDAGSPPDAAAVPLLEDSIAAGAPVPISGVSSESRWFLASWLRKFKNPLLVRVGDNQNSMLPTIRPGDLLLVDRRPVLKPVPDEIYVVNTGEGGTIKRCHLSRSGLRLIPDNPDYSDRIIDVRGVDIRKIIVGRVVWIGRELVNQNS